jgi:hypothetical protein
VTSFFWKFPLYGYLCSPIKNGAVAQSVEQRTENPCVAGSIPAHTTINRKYLNDVSGLFFSE